MLFLHECINDNSAESTLENIIFQNKVSVYSVLLVHLWQKISCSKFLHIKKFQVISNEEVSKSTRLVAAVLGFTSGSTVLWQIALPTNVFQLSDRL